jgi:YD repeat-containing protein
LLGEKSYVVSCWIHTNHSQIIPDIHANGQPLVQSDNHSKPANWLYYQAVVTLTGNEDTIILHNPGTTVWIDNIVIAPLGAAYTIKTFDKQGNVDMEGSLNGKQVRYSYDKFGRVLIIRDENFNIKETYNYHLSR